MNSSKLLRVGMPVLGLCVITVFGSGCRPEVLGERPSVPPAERELIENESDFNAPSTESSAAVSVKTSGRKSSSDKIVYPRFEDTDHTPIYSAPKRRTSSSAAVGSGSTYIVRRGDSLSRIAARYRIRTIDLAKANNLQLTSVIRIGQKLVIPGRSGAAVVKATPAKTSAPDTASATASRPGLYVVRRGDSISRIAKRFKIKRADLMALNNINENTILRIGQTLKLPGAQVVNEESVIVDTSSGSNTPSAPVAAPAADTEKSPEDAEASILKELEADTAAASSAATSADAPKAAPAASAAEAVATQTAPSDGGAICNQQDINIDDFCRMHNIKKADLIRVNAAITEATTILKKGEVIVLP